MKHAQNNGSIWSTLLVSGALTLGVAACTHSNVTAGIGPDSQQAQMSAPLDPAPRYFGEQYAAQQLALLDMPDDATVETF